jgi:hypothetical protein
VKRRWRAALALGGALAALVIVPVAGIELGCRAPIPGFDPHAPYRSIVEGRRAEARTWLTYPEWHIVYSAESLGRWLSAGQRPSGYAYGGDVAGFWRSFCAINRVARGQPGTSEAKVMIYTIGISFTVEMAVKSLYENTIGRVSEAIGGWRSADDRYAAAVQRRYATFMHEVPWYRFAFGEALRGAWRTNDTGVRHVERRAALTAEYLVKAGYAQAIGGANAAVNAPDALTLRLVVGANPAVVRAIDPRLRPVRSGGGMTMIEAPRYAQFTVLVQKLAVARVPLVEIAGNDDIFVTLIVPAGTHIPGTTLLDTPTERLGWRRIGTSVKVANLADMLAGVRAGGGTVEHVYDY